MGDASWVNGVNLAECTDELKLHELLDSSEDYEDRKIIRARLKDVLAFNRAHREEIIRHREEEREEAIRSRLRDANEQKRRTLAMYDAMAKSAPAGGNKVLDIGILRGEGSGSSTPTHQVEKVDFVEESIRQRQKESDDRKKVILAAYDQAAKSGPAGSARFVDFDNVRPEDILNYENNPKYSSTFQMKGGVPLAQQATPPVVHRPAVQPQPYDPEEAAIRRRKQEADERKRRTLEAYDKAAKSRPAGTPFSIYIPSSMDVEPVFDVVGRPSQRSGPNAPMTPPTQVRSSGPQYGQQQQQQPTRGQPTQPPPQHQGQYRGPPLSGPPAVAAKPQGQHYQQQQQQQQQHYQNQQQITLKQQNQNHYQHQQQQQKQHQPFQPTHDAYTPTPQQYLNQQQQNQYRNVPNFRPVAPTPNAATTNNAQRVTTQQQQQRQVTVTSNQQVSKQPPQQQQQQQRATATVNLSTNQTRVGNTTTTTTTTTRKQYYEEEDDEEEEEESDEEEEEEEEE